MNDNELMNRRRFFKKTAKEMLPMLGAFVAAPTVIMSTLTSCGPEGCDGCEAACRDNCVDSCKGACSDTCARSSGGGCSDCSSSCTGLSTGNSGKTDNYPTTGTLNGHGYVDLGLSVVWATADIGASNIGGYGNLLKCGDLPNDLSSERFGDICGTTYDVAYNNWGKGWRLPTEKELEEMLNHCSVSKVSYNGITGLSYKASNGNAIFFPLKDFKNGDSILSDVYKAWLGDFDAISGFGSIHEYYFILYGKDSSNLIFSRLISEKAELYVRPVIDKSIAISNCGNNCTSSCQESCSRTCAWNSKVSTCDSCSSSCSWTCSGTCSAECTGTCFKTCEESCYINCNDTCESKCDKTCKADCASDCNSKCTKTCADNCSSNCTGKCTATCADACKAQTSQYCSNCASNCSSGCTTTCADSCKAQTSQGCDGCSNTCKTGCGRQCYWSCGGSCDKQCEGACITGCQGYSRGSCSGTCFGSCSTQCSSSCRSYCYSSCTSMGVSGT